MIIGKGDIASILNDRDDITFFASGVSNSSETRWEEFDREKKLLFEQDKDICLLYFSSIAIDIKEKYDNSKYLKHKKEMEDLIKSNFKNYNNPIQVNRSLFLKNFNTELLNKIYNHI